MFLSLSPFFDVIAFGVALTSWHLPSANPLQPIFFQNLVCRGKNITDIKILSDFQLEEFDLSKAKGHYSK